MSLFWIVAAVLIVVALAAVLVPLLRSAGALPRRADYNIAVYRDQLAEVERDIERGVLTSAQAEQARLEIQRRLLAADTERRGPAPADPRRGPMATLAAVVIAAGLPIGALVTYLSLGDPGTPDLPFAARNEQSPTQLAQHKRMAELVDKLAARLKDHPDSLEGWLLLANSSTSLGRIDQALKAYDRALALSDRRPDILSAYAEVLVMAHNGQVDQSAAADFHEVLQKNPKDARARFYLGMAKAQAGDLKAAIDAWTALIKDSPPDAAWLPSVREQIRLAADQLGVKAPAVAAAQSQPPAAGPMSGPTTGPAAGPAAGEPGGAAMPGPTREQMDAAAQMSSGDREQMIHTMVDRLAQRLKDNPDDLQGWIRLERAYRVLGETAKADAAAKHIAELRAKQ